MNLIFLLLNSALAGPVLDVRDPVAVPLPAEGVLLAHGIAGPEVVVVGSGGAWVLDLASGTAVTVVLPGLHAGLGWDARGSGLDDLLLCGDDGVFLAAAAADGFSDPVLLDASPCEALAPYSDGFVSAGADVRILSSEGTFLSSPGMTLEGPPLLATGPGALDAAWVGGSSVWDLGAWGVSSLAMGGTIAGMANVNGVVVVSLSDLAVLRTLDGGTSTLEAVPGRIAAGDLDGDGLSDVVVLYPEDGLLDVRPGDGGLRTRVAAPLDATALAVGDLDGDACDDLAWLDPQDGALSLATVSDCLPKVDTGGDTGSGAETGGETGTACVVTVDGPDWVDEGDPVTLHPHAEDCDVAYWDVSISDTRLLSQDVWDAEWEYTAWDNGEVDVTVRAMDAVGHVEGTASTDLSISNVPPTLDLPYHWFVDDFSDGNLRIRLGESYTDQFSYEDPGADTVTFTSTGNPPGWALAPDGALVVGTVVMGSWDVDVTVTDDDGGSSTETLTLIVDDGSCDSGLGCDGCCSSSSALMGVGAFGLLLRRRRIRRP